LKPVYKYILLLLLLNVLITGTGFLLVSFTELNLLFSDIALLAIFFSLIAAITLIIFFRGQAKEPESQTMHSLFSVGLKFLLEMILALVWFIVAKKTSLTSVLIFFVLYLTLTLFSVLIILKTLKNKSL
jgi:uncharacterized membrane protein